MAVICGEREEKKREVEVKLSNFPLRDKMYFNNHVSMNVKSVIK